MQGKTRQISGSGRVIVDFLGISHNRAPIPQPGAGTAMIDYTVLSLTLRYNENWADEGSRFNVPRFFVDYYATQRPLLDYVVHDWRDSKLVAPLNVSPPKSPNRGPAELEFVPMTIKSDDIKIILLPHGGLDQFLESKRNVPVYIVNWTCSVDPDQRCRLLAEQAAKRGWQFESKLFERELTLLRIGGSRYHPP